MRRKVKKHSRRMRRKSSFRKTKHKKKRGGAPGEEEEAADDPPPPDGAWQMVHQDPANKKGKRVFCEGKLGTITDAKDDSMGSYCKIQYDNGTTTNKNANDGYLRFANASGMSNPTIPCYASEKPLKDAGLTGEQIVRLNFSAILFMEKLGYSAKVLKDMGFPFLMVQDKIAWQMVHQDPATKLGKRVFCENKLGTITDTVSNKWGSYCKIQYDDGTKNTNNSDGGYLRFANAFDYNNPTMTCFAIGNKVPPDKLTQMEYNDPAIKRSGQRVFCEGKDGMITDVKHDSNGSYCKIRYYDGSKNTDNGSGLFRNSGFLRFANAPGVSKPTIPTMTCFKLADDPPPPKYARQMVHKDGANKKGQRVFCEGKLGTITEGLNALYKSYCTIQYDDGSKNTGCWGSYLLFAKISADEFLTIPCYAIGILPPDDARQMEHKDRANKKDQRVFCEGKDGMITDVKHDNKGSYCKIQYDDGTKNTDNTNDGYLRFANASGMSNPTILCFTNNKPPLIPSPNTLKSDSGQFERCECLNWDGDEPITQEPLNGYKCEELILLPSKNCMTKDAVDNMVKRVDPYNRESFG